MYLKPGLLAASASAMAVEIGSTVDEPDTTIEPDTAAGADPLAAGADAAVVAAALGAVVAVVGAALEPEFEHAANTNAAAKTTAVRRFGVDVVTRGSSCTAHASWRAGGLGRRGWGLDRPRSTPAGVTACLF